MNNIFTPNSKCPKTKLVFYVFELSALVIGIILFIMSVVSAAKLESFAVFVDGMVQAVFYVLILFGFGKIIDLLGCKPDHCKPEAKNEQKDDVDAQ